MEGTWAHATKPKKLELSDYQTGFPHCLSGFTNRLIETLQKKKHEVARVKRIYRGLEEKPINIKHIEKYQYF
jgi:hypothetical protein